MGINRTISRIKNILKFGKKDALQIVSENPEEKQSKIYIDIIRCFIKYRMNGAQYKKEKFWTLSEGERELVGNQYKEKCLKNDQWADSFYQNIRFLIKWSRYEYEAGPKLQRERIDAYCRRYNLGDHCYVGHGVLITRHHYSDGVIKTGTHCHISENVNIDYTGGLTLGYKGSISEGVKILTHNHVTDFSGVNVDKGCVLSPLVIQDRVWIGARAIIMPGVREIGRGAMISSCAYVHTKVPPYAIVMGNPAKVVGFRFTPEETIEFEKNNYSEENRLPEEVINNNYNKYFRSRWKELKEFARI